MWGDRRGTSPGPPGSLLQTPRRGLGSLQEASSGPCKPGGNPPRGPGSGSLPQTSRSGRPPSKGKSPGRPGEAPWKPPLVLLGGWGETWWRTRGVSWKPPLVLPKASHGRLPPCGKSHRRPPGEPGEISRRPPLVLPEAWGKPRLVLPGAVGSLSPHLVEDQGRAPEGLPRPSGGSGGALRENPRKSGGGLLYLAGGGPPESLVDVKGGHPTTPVGGGREVWYQTWWGWG